MKKWIGSTNQPRNTAVHLSTPYADPEHPNTHRHRQTDGQTDRLQHRANSRSYYVAVRSAVKNCFVYTSQALMSKAVFDSTIIVKCNYQWLSLYYAIINCTKKTQTYYKIYAYKTELRNFLAIYYILISYLNVTTIGLLCCYRHNGVLYVIKYTAVIGNQLGLIKIKFVVIA